MRVWNCVRMHVSVRVCAKRWWCECCIEMNVSELESNACKWSFRLVRNTEFPCECVPETRFIRSVGVCVYVATFGIIYIAIPLQKNLFLYHFAAFRHIGTSPQRFRRSLSLSLRFDNTLTMKIHAATNTYGFPCTIHESSWFRIQNYESHDEKRSE